jgi:hypothetical protein
MSSSSTINPIEQDHDDDNMNVGQSDIGRQTANGKDNQIIVKVDDNIRLGQFKDDDDDNNIVTDITSTRSSWRSLVEVSSAKSRKIRGSNYVQLATVDPISNEPRCRTVVFRGFLPIPTVEEDNTLYPPSSSLHGMSCIMKMITDARSQKVSEIGTSNNNNNNAEMVWWFPKLSEQYRIRGRLVFVGENGAYPASQSSSSSLLGVGNDRDMLLIARKSQWGNLSDSARESFFDIPNVPGLPYTTIPVVIPPGGRELINDNNHQNDNNSNDNDNNNNNQQRRVLPPPSNFLLVLLIPTYCDYLNLKTMYRQIDTFTTQIQENNSSNDNNSVKLNSEGNWTSIRVNP